MADTDAPTPLLRGIFDKLVAGLGLIGGDGSAVASAANPLPVVGPLSQAVGGTLTRDTNTTQYTAGDLIAPAAGNKYITLAVARAVDTPVWIKRLRLKVNDNAWKGSTVRVHLFKDAPTVTPADNAALNSSETYAFTESNYLGYVEITLTQQTNDATALVKGFATADIIAEPSSGTVNIFAVLECRSTPTPAASKVFTLTAEVVRD
jgi:hypothetical protein